MSRYFLDVEDEPSETRELKRQFIRTLTDSFSESELAALHSLGEDGLYNMLEVALSECNAASVSDPLNLLSLPAGALHGVGL